MSVELNEKEAVVVAQKLHPNIDFSKAVFNGMKKAWDLVCKVCTYEWNPIANKVLKDDFGCPSCKGKAAKPPKYALKLAKEQHRDIDFSKAVYKGSNTKWDLKCKRCANEWSTIPKVTFRGAGCPECSGSKKLTQEKAIAKGIAKHKDIDFLNAIYVNNSTKWKLHCKKCNHKWSPRPADTFSGKGCPKCAGNIPLNEQEAINRAKKIHPNIDFSLAKYVNYSTPWKLSCNICGHNWESSPSDTISGKKGCKRCANNTLKSQEEVIAQAKKIHPNIDFSKAIYKGNKVPWKLKCEICNHDWEAVPSSTIKKKTPHGCPKCANNINLTQEEAINKAKAVNPDIDYSDAIYVNNHTKWKLHCKKCKHTWNASPQKTFDNRGCPNCTVGTSDNDAIYIWKTPETYNDEPVYKIGVTSERLGKDRIYNVARKKGWSRDSIKLISYNKLSCNATLVEAELLNELFPDKKVNFTNTFDGSSEMRYLSNKDLDRAIKVINKNSIANLLEVA